MVKRAHAVKVYFMLFASLVYAVPVRAELSGSIRGTLYDKDFEVQLADAKITIAETGREVKTNQDGNFLINNVKPGTYTLVFSKDGYIRHVKADVPVIAGQMAEGEVWLEGEFTEMEEFVVEDVQIGTGTEAALLDLRMEAPGLMDSISSDLMSQAGASDAAGALKLVAGATVQDGKYAVIRGLPDRYVNSQLNGVRLPTADADKRAVQLDQFPSAVIESIQVSKTFTPDQQGDASGGAVNIVLKGIPTERILKLETGISFNSQVTGNDDFLTYKGGGLDYFGMKDMDRPEGESDIAVNIFDTQAPYDYKYSVTYGDKFQLTDDIQAGGLFSFFYDRDVSFYDGGIDDKYWQVNPGDPLIPRYSGEGGFDVNGSFKSGNAFTTSLYDVTKSSQQVQWGTLGSFGIETENNTFTFVHMFTQTTDDEVRLAEDTRGKAAYFPGYSPDDINDPGNDHGTNAIHMAPYLRSETLTYTERNTEIMQFGGKHRLAFLPDMSIGNMFNFDVPEFDWKISTSSAGLEEDKLMFNSRWIPEHLVPGQAPSRYNPAGTPPQIVPPQFIQHIGGANINFGNFFRVFKDINEESDQVALNFKLPFEQWSGDEGYFKTGIFTESLKRDFNQDSYGNSQHGTIKYDDYWTGNWARHYFEGSYMSEVAAKIKELDIDMDYKGTQDISAWYLMADMPINSNFNIIGGYRFEDTELAIETNPEPGVEWIVVRNELGRYLNDNDLSKANTAYKQSDVLPSIGFVYEPVDYLTFRGSYTETVARQTFKELSAAPQQEYLGGDVFIGNPELMMSALKNYDLRLDIKPYEGGLFSMSYFYKDITNPIEYIQAISDFSFTTPVNYPKGRVSGYEFEIRQKLGHFFERLEGISLGGNATFINSEVTLPQEEIELFRGIGFPATKRDMMNAPEHLYNIFLTYAMEETGTNLGLFYTIRGDTLIAGAGQAGGYYIPNVYEKEFGTLNFSVSQKLGDWNLKFQAKNLLDPEIESVYRSDFFGDDVTKSSYRKGIEYSIGLSRTF